MKIKDAKKIEAIVKETLYNSIAQAIFRIGHTPHLIVKIFLFVCVFVSTGISSYLVIESILRYLSFEVNTHTRRIFEMPTEFPKVTICNYNQFTTEFAFQFISDLYKRIVPLNQTLDEKTEENILYYINRFASSKLMDTSFSDLTKAKFAHTFEDVLLACSFNNEPCGSKDFAWTIDSQFGNCYVFNSGVNASQKKVPIKNSTMAGPLNGLSLAMYLNFHENLTLFNSLTGGLGGLIRIENSSYLNDHTLDGIQIMPGLATNIAIDRTFILNLPKPYSNCEIDNDTPIYFESDFYRRIAHSAYGYTQQFCFKQCLQHEIIKRCNCTHPFVVSLFPNAKPCFSEAQFICAVSNFFELNAHSFIRDSCVPLCPLECNSTQYLASVSSIQIVGDYFARILKRRPNLVRDFVTRPVNAQLAKESVVSLNIFYDSLSYTKSIEIPQLDLVSLLSNIGGTLSLFLGISVFSLFELVEVLVEIYYMKKTLVK